DPQFARQRIEAESPGLAKAIGPDLRPDTRAVAEWIVRRDRIRLADIRMIDVDAEHFAQWRSQVLGVALRITLRAGVAHPDVKKTVGPEGDAAAGVHISRARKLDDRS